jgi:drug/metabolite transporter (DMT)-like permease
MDDSASSRRAALPALIAGFAAIYLIWGSTYLGTKIAVQTLPPFLMAGTRFLLAGLFLYSLRRGQGVARPGREQWRSALLTGALLFLGGNGLVTWGQQFVATGTAALLIATTPIWMALLGWLYYGGARPGLRLVLGMGLGFVGAVLLIRPSSPDVNQATLWGMLAILASPVVWSLGSFQTRQTAPGRDPMLTTGLQMLCGGALMVLVGTGLGEWQVLAERSISARSALAFLYLTLIGSLIGFSTYAWLLRVASPTAVATYAYVNPLVAVLLGWLVLDEVPGLDVLLAATLIVSAVVLITLPRSRPTRPAVERDLPRCLPITQRATGAVCAREGAQR